MKTIGGRLAKFLTVLALLIGGVVATASAAQAAPATVHPASVTTICSTSPVPSGWVITAINTNAWQCGGSSYTIQTPVSPMGVCDNSPIPSGWVITAIHTNVWQCAGGNSYTIQTPVSPMGVCDNSPIPSGWVITAIHTNVWQCAGGNSYTIAAV
ncbi:hypothetical protein [Streptomyces roseochromogenus]|uniref:Secreted protein n=1 Tax=Streptomyces roseochromogenus subsp. oscitans DS 12.976 TaxID=1352936 RepID=V6L0X6_STRRC|nr:hypothetical protein [Streptomyces roseochromogenus]EST34874.1 hypothetical protein M878_08400 [Streptomyces roseochromogenus subsp. oscitans DS 12.976]